MATKKKGPSDPSKKTPPAVPAVASPATQVAGLAQPPATPKKGGGGSGWIAAGLMGLALLGAAIWFYNQKGGVAMDAATPVTATCEQKLAGCEQKKAVSEKDLATCKAGCAPKKKDAVGKAPIANKPDRSGAAAVYAAGVEGDRALLAQAPIHPPGMDAWTAARSAEFQASVPKISFGASLNYHLGIPGTNVTQTQGVGVTTGGAGTSVTGGPVTVNVPQQPPCVGPGCGIVPTPGGPIGGGGTSGTGTTGGKPAGGGGTN